MNIDEVEIGDLVDAGEGPRVVCFINRDTSTVKLAGVDWRKGAPDSAEMPCSDIRRVKP